MRCLGSFFFFFFFWRDKWHSWTLSRRSEEGACNIDKWHCPKRSSLRPSSAVCVWTLGAQKESNETLSENNRKHGDFRNRFVSNYRAPAQRSHQYNREWLIIQELLHTLVVLKKTTKFSGVVVVRRGRLEMWRPSVNKLLPHGPKKKINK